MTSTNDYDIWSVPRDGTRWLQQRSRVYDARGGYAISSVWLRPVAAEDSAAIMAGRIWVERDPVADAAWQAIVDTGG